MLGNLVALNFSKSGLGASIGIPGARLGIDGTAHAYFRGSLPGSGIFYHSRLPHQHSRDSLSRYYFGWVLIIGLAWWLLSR